jgi:hypothetical protein
MVRRLIVRSIEFTERPVRFRMPFRFGAARVDGAPQVFVHAEIELEDGSRSLGASAELMVPKWFNKDPALTPEQTVQQLRRALDVARDLYLSHGKSASAFGLHAACNAAQIATCGAETIPPLAAHFGTAEIDKAILDALLRAADLDVFSGFSRNVMGLDARLTPDIDDAAIADFLSSRVPASEIAIRHTVGMADPLEALAGIHRATGCRYFKLKLGGDVAVDCERRRAVGYRLSRDAGCQRAICEPVRSCRTCPPAGKRACVEGARIAAGIYRAADAARPDLGFAVGRSRQAICVHHRRGRERL